MSNYENAPATKMIATHCCVCARPLVDAKSVELGIGPDCRKRYGFDLDVPEEARKEANAMVHRIAMLQTGREAADLCSELKLLGFEKLSRRILERLTRVRVTIVENDYDVVAPFVEDAGLVYQAETGCKGLWQKDTKSRRFPRSPKTQRGLHAALTKLYPGVFALGPSGNFFVIGETTGGKGA